MAGNFQFPVEFRQNYPRVTAYLEKMLPYLQHNQAVVDKIKFRRRDICIFIFRMNRRFRRMCISMM